VDFFVNLVIFAEKPAAALLLTVVYHTELAWATLARGYVSLEFDRPMYDASSGSRMRRWFLLKPEFL